MICNSRYLKCHNKITTFLYICRQIMNNDKIFIINLKCKFIINE
nr:MAG TPA: hypothetical protein [Caudoviricetes sp.]